jgi:hypothetical protein
MLVHSAARTDSPSATCTVDAVSHAIFVLGAPRSGTTWLAKILDSHPDVLYRHEPDQVLPPDPENDPLRQTRAWATARTVRIAAKRPSFPKSFRSPSRAMLREMMATVLRGASRLPGAAASLERVQVPDLIVPARAQNLRIALKLVNWDATPIARALPDTRHLFIVRHPCGQVASAMHGMEKGHFGNDGTVGALAAHDTDRAVTFAGTRGTGPGRFAALSEAAKFAWSWLAFNETTLDSLEHQRNVQIVQYESLCEHPVEVTRTVLDFAGLSWHEQTEAFLSLSTRHDSGSGYFDVLRSSAHAAERWRATMSPEDQHAVRDVVRGSRLARLWPDIANAA